MTTTFHKHYVTNGKDKVRVSYFLNWDRNGTPFVSVTDSAVDITLKSMSLKLVSTFGWSETDARNRVFV